MAHVGLRSIGRRVHGLAQTLKQSLVALGFKVGADAFFDTIVIETKQAADFVHKALEHGFNLRLVDATTISIALDEVSTRRSASTGGCLRRVEDP